MEPRFTIWALRVWAIAGAPVLFGLYVFWSYRYALSRGQLPSSILPEWLWFAVFGTCVASGVAAVNFFPYRRLWVRITINIIYVSVIIVILLFVHLMVACTNGDCL
jgi:drug/metabolite transporter (DMT)-like permease